MKWAVGFERHLRHLRARGFPWTLPQNDVCVKSTYHSLNLATHSCKSPLVSNFGYVIARTVTFGRACCRIAFKCEGKPAKVSSPP